VGKQRRCGTFDVGVAIASGVRIDLSLKADPERGIQIHEQSISEGESRGTLRPDMTSEEIEAAFPSAAEEWFEIFPASRRGKLTGKRQARPPVTLKARRNRCFLEVIAKYGGAPSLELPGNASQFPIEKIGNEIRKLIHLPGLRGNPERTYRLTGVGRTIPGTFETYVATVIAKWQSEDKDKLEMLNGALDALGLTYRVVAKPVAETRVELMVGRLAHGKREGENDLVSVADVGFGVSQTLPVLVALLVAKPGQAVYLEEPEIHLHPRAQSRMAGILAEAATRGVRVIAETHSSTLLRSIQTLVATGKLRAELVKLHWFTRSPEDGSTEIHSADLDKEGAFGDWPEDFDEVALETEKKYLDAAEASHRS
jgi:hypothetical protein